MCADHFRFWELCEGEEEGNSPQPQPDDKTPNAICGSTDDAAFWWKYFSAVGILEWVFIWVVLRHAKNEGQEENHN